MKLSIIIHRLGFLSVVNKQSFHYSKHPSTQKSSLTQARLKLSKFTSLSPTNEPSVAKLTFLCKWTAVANTFCRKVSTPFLCMQSQEWLVGISSNLAQMILGLKDELISFWWLKVRVTVTCMSHSCQCYIFERPGGNFITFGINIYLDSCINLLEHESRESFR